MPSHRVPEWVKKMKEQRANNREEKRIRSRAKRLTRRIAGKGKVRDPSVAISRTGKYKGLASIYMRVGRSFAVDPSKVRAKVNSKKRSNIARQYLIATSKRSKKKKYNK